MTSYKIIGVSFAPSSPKEWKELNDTVKFIEFEYVNGLYIHGVGLINGHGKDDDCVSIGDGISNVNISYVTCGPGHGIRLVKVQFPPHIQNVIISLKKNCKYQYCPPVDSLQKNKAIAAFAKRSYSQ
uniref:Uncharacterized protein n=1 Tax=Quercus lobata TaxID=97700 RepID=A0A7N2LP44_QUELO